jgi:hypothetical protein
MELKIFIDVSIQPERFNILMYFSEKYKLFNKYKIKIVNDYQQSNLILFLVNSRNNLINLNKDHYVFQTDIPIILLERQDSSITWVREFDKIKNLKAVFKNRKLKPKELQNSDQVYYGKYQYHLIHKNFQVINLESKDATDIGIDYYPKNKKLPQLSTENLEKIMCVLWDFHSSPLCQKLSMKYFRFNQIHFKKEFDIFCVNQKKTNNFVNIPREKAKKIVNSLKNKYKVITKDLKKEEYEEIFSKCKIAVACWGFGEWVHMDGYAMFAGAILIKPNTDHVKMYPDIYRAHQTYIPCAHDYSDLQEVIEHTLKNYDKYIPMIKENRKFLSNINEENTSNLFWQKVLKVMNINPKKYQK